MNYQAPKGTKGTWLPSPNQLGIFDASTTGARSEIFGLLHHVLAIHLKTNKTKSHRVLFRSPRPLLPSAPKVGVVKLNINILLFDRYVKYYFLSPAYIQAPKGTWFYARLNIKLRLLKQIARFF